MPNSGSIVTMKTNFRAQFCETFFGFQPDVRLQTGEVSRGCGEMPETI
jgi:hypothetical protein